ncbi:DUF4064 domain-containing protein [Listeria aquatica]|uniref:DUF4064 domain-containing protein n=1 Tax=Listeria aquatica TaxID=1494960 RepID=A0A841ZNR1_9LIST|nr:DUF4064 domain-containing protein [Listeria aquatica]MBC1520341.1 DUF4064 domain-containing protein [Listeria aquatica]
MIKRTGEVVLSVIGLVLALILQGAMTIVSFNFMTKTNTESGYQVFADNYEQAIRDAGVNLNDAPAARSIVDALHGFNTFFIVALIVVILLSILGIIFIVGNKKPVLAGFLFLFAGIVVILATFLVGFVPALLFLIAAIMCWARKPKRDAFSNF